MPGDSGWWFSNGVSVASSLSMMIPSMAAVKGLSFLGKGMSKAAGLINKSLDIAGDMTKQARWATTGVSQAIVSRHIENSMEAAGTFDSYKAEKLNQVDPQTGEKFTEERATQLASEAAASNYRLGWAMLAQDIPQYLALGKVFNPRTMKMESALKKAAGAGKVSKMGKFGQVAKGAGVTFVSEGIEESYQYYIAERGKLLSDLQAGLITEEEYQEELKSRVGDEEMMTSAFWGGLGGNIFQAAGKGVSEAFKSKTQRENEKNYAKMQGDFLNKRGEAFKLMQQELAAADESGDPARREAAIADMMLSMTIEAISLDKYDQHIETLNNTMNMSKEEQDAFAKEQGIELNQELFKQYAPKAVKKSKEIKEIYDNHFKRNDSSVAAHLTRNDIQIGQFEEAISKDTKDIESLKAAVPGQERMSRQTKNIEDNKSKISALKRANAVHKLHESKGKDKDSFRAKNIKSIIAENDKKIKELEKEIEKDTKDLDNREQPERVADSRYKNGYVAAQEAIFYKLVNSAMLSDGVVSRQKENIELKKDSYQKELRAKQFEFIIDKKLVDEKSADELKKEVQEDKFTADQKETLIKKIDAKLKVLTDQAAVEKAAAEEEQAEENLAKEQKKKQEENPDKIVDNGKTGDINNVLDDPLADEGVDLDGQNLDKDEYILSQESAESVGLLDELSGTEGLDNYKTWSENGESKIGQEITYELDFDYTGNDPLILDAIAEYEAMGDNPVVTQDLIDYLPIKARVNKSAHTFIPTRTKNNPRFDELVPERTAILELLFAGKEAKTVITHTSGGSLVQDLGNRTGKVPEYSVSDLQQISSNEDVKFMVTNEEGELVDMDKRYLDEFGRYRMSVGDDTNGNPMPYRGGVFMVVKKADGTLFPMKLSINKNTAEQAEVLADMIIQSMVADNKDGKSNLSFQTPLSLLPEDLRASIESQMGLEIEVLKEDEKDDPKMIDIINMFAYVSDRTSGYTSQLYTKKGVLHFGVDGQTISREQKNNPESRAQLIEFLTNVKRRQFSLDMYNKFPKYHDFIIDNKIVSTNSTITEPLFQSDFSYIDGSPSGRRVQAYVKPIHKPKVKKSDADITAADIILPTVEERSVQKDLGPDTNSESRYYMELTEKIKEAFPNKDYWSLDEVLSDGVYVVKTFKGVTVPRKKLIELENFKTEFFKSKGIDYTSKFVSIKEENNTTAPVVDLAIDQQDSTQQDSDRKTFDSLGEELELQGNEIYYKDTEEGEGGLHSDYDTAEEAAKAFKSLSQPKPQTSEVKTIKRNFVELETPINEFEIEVQQLLNSPNPTIEQYENAVGNYEFDLSSDISNPSLRKEIETMLRDVKNSFTISKPAQQTSADNKKVIAISSPFEQGKFNADEDISGGLFIATEGGQIIPNPDVKKDDIRRAINSVDTSFKGTWNMDNAFNNNHKGIEVITPAKYKIETDSNGNRDIVVTEKGTIKFTIKESVTLNEASQSPTQQSSEVSLSSETVTDAKGRTFTYFENTKTKGGVKTTTYTFNRSDKDSSQRNSTRVKPEVALDNKGYKVAEGSEPIGAKINKVFEVRINETDPSKASATVEFLTEEGKTFKGEVLLAQSPNVNDTEVRNTQENVVPSQESEADARKRLLERSKKRTRGTGRRTASRKETEKSPRVTLIEKKSDFENLNPGKINKDCKG